jgi:hypothetical protein
LAAGRNGHAEPGDLHVKIFGELPTGKRQNGFPGFQKFAGAGQMGQHQDIGAVQRRCHEP